MIWFMVWIMIHGGFKYFFKYVYMGCELFYLLLKAWEGGGLRYSFRQII